MSYYSDRVKAMRTIRKMFSDGHDLETVRNFIIDNFGFSKKFVNEYYDNLIDRGFVKVKK